LTLVGKKRKFKMTRLLKEARKGDTEILITTDLDLVKNDRIVLVTTSYLHDTNEEHFVESYDAKTGKTKLKKAV